jgi:hypothetical protein
MIAQGRGAELAFDGDYVTIRRRGLFSLVSVGLVGEKKISIHDISAVQFREAWFAVIGFIRFSFRGGQEKLGGFEAVEADENAVTFRPSSNQAMRELRDAVESRLVELRTSTSERIPSAADEIAKFADLRDKGIITAAEFEAKKNQLLG